MGNSGFVTDSDTERELREWQQARENPIDENRLRQQYKNKQNNAQGQHHHGLGGEIQKNVHIRAGEERNAGLGQYRHGSRDLHTNVRPYRRSTYRNSHDFFYKDSDTDSLEKDTGGRGKGIFSQDGSSR